MHRPDNGRKWLGRLPHKWESRFLKHKLRKITDGAHVSPDMSESAYPFVSTVDIKNGRFDFDNCLKTSLKSFLTLSSQGCRPKEGDVLFSKDGTVGKTVLIFYDKDFVVASSLIILTPNKSEVFPAFLDFMLRSHFVLEQINSFVKGSALKRVSLLNIKKVIGVFPSIREQQLISSYLKRTCQLIDKTITTKQDQLETLEALKKSIIHKAVTQGLDDSVEMKDSGVEWIGEIPSHWKVKIVKRDFTVTLGKMLQSQQKNEFETEEYYLRSANIKWAGVDVSKVKKMWFSPFEREKLKLELGDLLVSEGGDVGRSSIWNGELSDCFIQNAINRIRPISGKGSNHFLYYWLFTLKTNGHIDAVVSRITIAHLTAEKLEKLIFLSPPIKEQKKIATHLDQKTTQIEKLKKNIVKQIETLELYRKSIVHECVTGKRRITIEDLKEQ